jgi:hypothetical protein
VVCNDFRVLIWGGDLFDQEVIHGIVASILEVAFWEGDGSQHLKSCRLLTLKKRHTLKILQKND